MKIFCLLIVALSHVTSFSNMKLRMSATPFDILGSGLKSLKEVQSTKAPASSTTFYEHPVCFVAFTYLFLSLNILPSYDFDSFFMEIGFTGANDTFASCLWNEGSTRIFRHINIRTRPHLWQRPSWHR